MGKLDGKYAVVTGGGKGIGEAIVQRFLEDGAAGVAILDYDIELAEKTAAALGEKVFAVKCDVGDSANVAAAFKTVYEKMGRVDILVNNAGLTRDSMLHKMSEEQWRRVMSADLDGVFFCCKQVVDGMRAQNYGKIVNVSSVSAFGNPGQANYSAAKAGIIGLTRTLGKELFRYNINVNAVAPGWINTDIIKTVPKEMLEAGIKSIPARRVGEPSEVASVISFLSSDDCSFMGGSCLVIAGGLFN
ncbi:3-oxoacyl-ACP reductase FabG [Papillibacter cinnamivorans]|uniref:3-oxoacyl-[acyl-carrier protein] reductase n=1 Tax=Papillibacter cinnamivorans DSM 12816 TaxID=1122930 RepID=A0A1W2CZ25_9FIRM|nr:3-oxoacyl-ACP reductase FabG [Papillibacter cinnamivorans]SMC90082.1 3-oxoacyl-[acyl-carrier protein] reductase [Papillibacter cinnamivorans DSM 12816]